MSGYVAKFRQGSEETGYLNLIRSGQYGSTKERVKSPDAAMIFLDGNEAVIQAAELLSEGETVEPIERK